ncbi:uncharacterized protein LOC133885325 isoform X1 [Phragmites australis]|uniref:uncharacterized protein LOC133885325 isoform X1 n=1 Tax=Phragmites australis TaxID=29695 RepID=UPI002D77A818|nr:uncharacterized protein LOC133885325 isoform X1 [Phragmites australis]
MAHPAVHHILTPNSKYKKKKIQSPLTSPIPDSPTAAPRKPSPPPPPSEQQNSSSTPRDSIEPSRWNLGGIPEPTPRGLQAGIGWQRDGGERRPLRVPGRAPPPPPLPGARAAASGRGGEHRGRTAARPRARRPVVARGADPARQRASQKKESSKKKEELSKKSKEKKERVGDSSSKGPVQLVARPNAPPYTLPVLPMDDDDVSYKAIGGPTGQLLEHNAQILNQIYTNISNMQVQDNLSLLCQTRDNILTVLKEVSDVPEIMRQMPPLPVKLNEDLANSMLPRPPGT